MTVGAVRSTGLPVFYWFGAVALAGTLNLPEPGAMSQVRPQASLHALGFGLRASGFGLQTSRRPSIALCMVNSSAYSRSLPTGTPIAIRVTRTPSGLRSLAR
jgi:hypothetical protein